MVGEGITGVAPALATGEHAQFLARRVGELVHQQRQIGGEAKTAAVGFMVDDQHWQRQFVERHGRDRAARRVVAQHAGGQHDAVDDAGLRFQAQRDGGRGLCAAAGADQPQRQVVALAQLGRDGRRVLRVLGGLAKTAEIWRQLPVRRRIDDGHHQPIRQKEIAAAHQKVPAAPAHRAVGEDAQAAVPARVQHHDGARLRRRFEQDAVGDAAAGWNIDHCRLRQRGGG